MKAKELILQLPPLVNAHLPDNPEGELSYDQARAIEDKLIVLLERANKEAAKVRGAGA